MCIFIKGFYCVSLMYIRIFDVYRIRAIDPDAVRPVDPSSDQPPVQGNSEPQEFQQEGEANTCKQSDMHVYISVIPQFLPFSVDSY